MNSTQKQAFENTGHKDALVAFFLAIAAAMLIKMPILFGLDPGQHESFYFRNLSLFVLPPLTLYFVWKRRLELRSLISPALAFAAGLIFANIYRFEHAADTGVLLALHLPVALWFIVGVAHSAGAWSRAGSRMDFIRFTGEFFIYFALIGLGGGVLTGFMAVIFGTIEIDIEPFFESWLLPCGAAGAVIIAAWLAEVRSHHTGNFAPVLARLFSPLFALMLIIFLGTLIWTGSTLIADRNILIAFDLLLVVVLGLLLYSISARDPQTPPGISDIIQVVLLISALLVDAAALWSIAQRIAEFGLTPNRIAASGLNVILLTNLTGSAVLYIRFLRGKSAFSAIEKWQTDYLSVYVIWAAIVVVIFPPLFGFR